MSLLMWMDADVADTLIQKDHTYANLLTEELSIKVKEIFEKQSTTKTIR